MPFNSFFLGSDGSVRPCCSLRGQLGDINTNTVEEIVNGPIATSIRQSIVNGEWHPMCSQCKELEQRGARDERVSTLFNFDNMKDYTPDVYRLEKLDIRWSNTCNLTCTYCYEYFSSKWAELKGIKVNANKSDAEEKVFAFIEKNVDNISNINLLGGEPLLQKPNIRLLDMLKPSTSIYILTNLTVPLESNKIAQKLLENKNVGWGISFETIGKRFEYVRHGGEWDRLVKNFRFLRDNQARCIDSHPLYCVYSAFNLVEYFEFLESEGYFGDQYWQVLQSAPGLDVFKLPKAMQAKALLELEKCFDRFGTKFNMTLLKNIYDALGKSVISSPSTRPCVDWLTYIDSMIPGKKEEFKVLWPDLQSEFEIYLQNTHQ